MLSRARRAPVRTPCTILLVDDQQDFLDLARELLGRDPGLRVVGQAKSGAEALALLPRVNPDLVIMDVYMPGMNGFETARRLIQSHPGTRVLMMTISPEAEFVPLAAEVGAIGFLDKREFRTEAVVQALERCLD